MSKSEITNAIALSASGMALMTLSGPGLGGLAYAWIGPRQHVFLDFGVDVCRILDDERGERYG